jgi:hypothetical protein
MAKSFIVFHGTANMHLESLAGFKLVTCAPGADAMTYEHTHVSFSQRKLLKHVWLHKT